ncbi:hypothetical protein [Aquimarina litoralis]|uniref:hypothetical protein n=1 Tax=Aquimarina litoralis TaxID=584605 RepID=UPI001C567BD3|nr:hypothetical protein [Aquimarina litoralis]MBW1299044.1 hypothetical protein [Aquimarina litoralis]
MKFIRKLFPKKKSQEEIQFDWNQLLQKIVDSLTSDELQYPIIILCDVLWDFRVFNTPEELIGGSIGGHWGLDHYFSGKTNELEIVIDSSGNTYKISHKHYHKETKTGFSYPSIPEGKETLENLKNRIIEGSTYFYSDIFPERENEIKDKQEYVSILDSIEEVIEYVGTYMDF